MKLNKIKITSPIAHFGKPLGRDNRATYDAPPPSTILGILKVIYGEEIEKENFVFGCTFKSKGKFIDDTTVYKHTNEGFRIEKGKVITDCNQIKYHVDCELIIYTDIDKEIVVKEILSIGRANSPTRIHFPIKKVELIDAEGYGTNQFTTKDIGKGLIEPINLKSKYNPRLNAYDHQITHLRFNRKFKYNKNYDTEEQQNIFLWKHEKGMVKSFD